MIYRFLHDLNIVIINLKINNFFKIIYTHTQGEVETKD